MAYQNVLKPRFYLDLPSYLSYIGQDITNNQYLGLNCSIMKVIESRNLQFEWDRNLAWNNLGFSNQSYFGFLNHNITDTNLTLSLNAESVENILNINYDRNIITMDNKGCSLMTFNAEDDSANSIEISMSELNSSKGIGCFTFGYYYDMPNSADLDLTMDLEFDGYDSVQTLGGSTITNVRYNGSPFWFDLDDNKVEPFSVGDSNGLVKRAGRRNWSMKFSYVSDVNLFASNFMSNNYVETSAGYNSDDLVNDADGNPNSQFRYNLLNDDSFLSIMQKIGNGQRFIFQPDNTNNNPDQFAICVLDQDSLSIKQVAHKVYDISLKIREVW
tara:strand:- start:565 stop:1551 length:987 start_codon:yes stop_codon:yes gene_type:complete